MSKKIDLDKITYFSLALKDYKKNYCDFCRKTDNSVKIVLLAWQIAYCSCDKCFANHREINYTLSIQDIFYLETTK